MTWDDCLTLGATRLSAILGCPVTTAHSWIRRSGPADWLKPILAAHVKQRNKTQKPMTPARKSKGRGGQ